MLKNLSIKNKLVGVIAYLAISLVIVGFVGVYFLGLSNETTKVMYEEKVTKLTVLDATIRLMNKLIVRDCFKFFISAVHIRQS